MCGLSVGHQVVVEKRSDTNGELICWKDEVEMSIGAIHTVCPGTNRLFFSLSYLRSKFMYIGSGIGTSYFTNTCFCGKRVIETADLSRGSFWCFCGQSVTN